MVTLIFLETLEILCQGSMAFSVEDFYHLGEGGVNVELFFFGMSLNVCNIKHFVFPLHPFANPPDFHKYKQMSAAFLDLYMDVRI